MQLRRHHHLTTWLVVSSILSLAALSGLLRRGQDSLVDLLFTPKDPPGNIVIVEINESSINTTGQWPWPRVVFGELVQKLQEAAVIGIDVNFKELSHLGSSDDAAFADAIASSKPPVVLTAEMQSDGRLASPIAPLAQHAQEGFPNLVLGQDGIARVIRYVKNGNRSFALRISQLYQERTNSPAITTIPNGLTRIDFRGPDRTFALVSALEVRQGRIPSSFFKDKIVLIGATARDLQDFHHTPMGIISGVEVQASIITTLLNQHFFTSSTVTTIWLIILLSAFVIALGMRIKRLRVYLPTLLTIFVVYNVIAFISFDRYVILDLLYPNLAIFGSAIASITVQYFFAHREKKFIQETFGRYLAPQVISELLQDPSKLKLGGQRVNLTILFSDIRGFTSFSETMSPEQLIHFLNDYLSHMSTIILDQHGVIDKYIGDAIMSFWGAPLANPHHALDGVLSALAMVEALQTFNEGGKEKNYPPIDIGIGLNSGDVTIGNMGSEKRFDYTVLGDNVNLASRLESLTKTYGINILVSQATVDAISKSALEEHDITMREIDRVKVKGKQQAVTLYQVVAGHKKDSVASIEQAFSRGREAYYRGAWQEAINAFDQVLMAYPDDGPSHTLRDRCEHFLKHPHESWQGVYEMTSK
jgi:adenylate cyclase